MHGMSVADVLLAYEDAMELYLLTNPWGDGSEAKGGSTSRGHTDATITATELEGRGLASVHTADSITELPPHVQDLVREFTGKGVN